MKKGTYKVNQKGKLIEPKKLKRGGTREGAGRPKGSLTKSKLVLGSSMMKTLRQRFPNHISRDKNSKYLFQNGPSELFSNTEGTRYCMITRRKEGKYIITLFNSSKMLEQEKMMYLLNKFGIAVEVNKYWFVRLLNSIIDIG